MQKHEYDDEHQTDYESFSDSLRSALERRFEAAILPQEQRIIDFMGEFMLSTLVDPEAGGTITQSIVHGWRELWPEMELELKFRLHDKLVKHDQDLKRVRSYRLKHWPTADPAVWSRPFTNLRAWLLHEWFPADEFPSHVATVMFVLQCLAPYRVLAVGHESSWLWCVIALIFNMGICNWVMYLRFAIIDRTDEYQLIMYILASRSFRFINNGVLPLFDTLGGYHNCVVRDIGDSHPCWARSPGRTKCYWMWVMGDLIHSILTWWAYALLCRSKGGDEHQVNLEIERLQRYHGGNISPAECRDLRLAYVRRLGVGGVNVNTRRERGGFLRYLAAYDFLSYFTCIIVYVGICMWIEWGWHGPDGDEFVHADEFHMFHHLPLWMYDWRIGVTYSFGNAFYSLSLLPIALLCVRPIQRYFVPAKPTGYDAQGHLAVALTGAEIASKGECTSKL